MNVKNTKNSVREFDSRGAKAAGSEHDRPNAIASFTRENCMLLMAFAVAPILKNFLFERVPARIESRP